MLLRTSYFLSSEILWIPKPKPLSKIPSMIKSNKIETMFLDIFKVEPHHTILEVLNFVKSI